jgi:hypothetical protein
MTIEQTIDIPASHKLTMDVPQEVPEGKAKVAFTPLTAGTVKPGVIFNPANLAKPRLSHEEERDRIQALCAGSKFTVDALLEERRRDLEREKE